MKLTFKLSFDNYYEYNRIYSRISVGKNLGIVFKIGVFEAIVGFCVLICRVLHILKNNTSLMLGIILAVIGIYMMLYSRVFFYTRMKREVQRRFKESDYFKNERVIEIEKDHLTTSSETDDYRANFNEDLKEIIETENLFMIMVHGRRGVIIPKTAVETKDFRQLLREVSEEYNVRYRSIRRAKK